MKIKWSYVFGTITIVAIVGGTAYAIKKSYDQSKIDEQAISVEEAKDMVKKQKEQEEVVHYEMDIDTNDITNDKEVVRKIVQAFSEDEIEDYIDELEDEDEEEVDVNDPNYDPLGKPEIEPIQYTVEPLNDFNYFEDGIDPKEDKTLRHDPNSRDAKYQYIRMELADWDPMHTIYRIMIQMFEYPFVPTNVGDENLRARIIDHKAQFFGLSSRWVNEVSYADVIFHYARCAEFECNESVQYWVEYFLDFVELDWDSTSEQMDRIVLRLNNHSYFNEERQTFGLFGLTRDAMDQAIIIANMNYDRSVTYEIEFNEFLKSIV